MNITKHILIAAVIGILITYLLGSFYWASFNITLWDKETRGSIAICLSVYFVTLLLTWAVCKIAEEN